uniref:Uncharacterized protein n=1 Tax=Anopheles christyi TaxID=43041 RepID=A0A182JP40_9DIPT
MCVLCLSFAVEALVKQWAPLVWLAPNEKYMPGDVSKFLEHVHAEEAKVVTVYPGSEITELDDLKYYDNGMTNELSYYDPVDQRQGRFRNKRNFKDPAVSLDLLFDLPIGNESKNWYLVTNNDIDELITHKDSFIHGQSPLNENVPIYAVVSMCKHSLSEMSHKPDQSISFTQTTTTTEYPSTHLLHNTNNQENEVTYTVKERPQYKRNPYAPTPKNIFELQPNLRQTMNKVEKSIRLIRRKREYDESTTLPGETSGSTNMPPKQGAEDLTLGRRVIIDSEDGNGKQNFITNTDDSMENIPRSEENEEWETITERRHDTERYRDEVSHDYPHFHVTYWMFYPYSQGKVMCTIDLGPFGPWPIPLIFGMCLGTKKEFGSHVGDWEHMSLYFRGRKEPDVIYENGAQGNTGNPIELLVQQIQKGHHSTNKLPVRKVYIDEDPAQVRTVLVPGDMGCPAC